ncbi:serine hydrolase [Nonomuraea sp. NPDC050310]|uniref:serine hydrolase n=1 Tax=Nonomuraea sp. NPDC050310 TaxID=3154935 RepID=UPI0033DFD447
MSGELDLGPVFAAAGVEGWLHATDLESGREVGHRPDSALPIASIFKLPLLVELSRQADAGGLDLTERITVGPRQRTFGPTGLSVMLDEVTISLRDLAYLMIAVSDNTAADVLSARVGLEAVNAMLRSFGLTRTQVVMNTTSLYASMAEDTGHDWPYQEPEDLARMRVLDPARANSSTPREMTRLLGLIWTDRAASPELCAWMRGLLGLQVWPHRLASGFPYDDVEVSGKTGSLPTIRNEVGVVEYPDGGRYAVAVFTRAFSPAANLPRADAVIGTTAHLAVDHLRAGRA